MIFFYKFQWKYGKIGNWYELERVPREWSVLICNNKIKNKKISSHLYVKRSDKYNW